MNNFRVYITLTGKFFPNVFLQLILMFLLNVFFPAVSFWGNKWWINDNRAITILLLIFVQYVILILFRVLMSYPGNRSTSFIFGSVSSVYGILTLFLVIFRFEYLFYLI